MAGSLEAFATVGQLIRRNPALFFGGFLLAGTKLTGALLAISHPLLYVPGLLLSIFGSPYFTAAYYGGIAAAIDGTMLDAREFLAQGNTYYFAIFIGRLGVSAIELLFVLLLVGLTVPVGITPIQQVVTAVSRQMQPPLQAIQSLTLLGLLVLLIAVIPLLLLHFSSAIIVLRDVSVADAYRVSVGFFRTRPVSVSGYFVVQGVIRFFAGIPAALLRLIATAGILSRQLPPELRYDVFTRFPIEGYLILLGLSFVVGIGYETLRGVYYVAFVDESS